MKKTLLILLVIVKGFSANAQTGYIYTYGGNGTAASSGDGGVASSASFNSPSGVFRDAVGNLFLVEYDGNRIRKINTSNIVSTIAGTGVSGFGGDGGAAIHASFNNPIDIIEDHKGNFYITDNRNHRIRKIDTSGIITTIAGNGTIGYTGDGGPATSATLAWPSRMAIDEVGNLYLADAGNNVIRMIDTSGVIHTVAGNGSIGYTGDGGAATSASLSDPLGVAFDGNGNMYIADGHNSCIRKVTPAGIISTWAGNGTYGFSGDGGPATSATMQFPDAIAIDRACNVYFTDWEGQRVRKITSTGIISTVVGNGTPGFSGDGGSATSAMIDGPDNLTFDNQSNLFIPDFHNNRVREVQKLGDTTGCPPITPIASVAAADSSVCEDSCITFTSTSTGAIDSIRWVAPGAHIASPTSRSTNICFYTTGATMVHLYAYGAGSVDSSSVSVMVNHCTSHLGITNLNSNHDDCWLFQIDNNTIVLNSAHPVASDISIALYDASGQKIFTEKWLAGTFSKQISNLFITPGLYIIKLSNGKVYKWVKK